MMIERVSGKMISSFFVEIVSDILRFGTVKYSMSDRLGTVSTTGALPVAFRVRVKRRVYALAAY